MHPDEVHKVWMLT